MKIRQDFVTNSSSSSFILSKKMLTEKQILAIKHHCEMAERMGMHNYDCPWNIEENDGFIGGYTYNDNFNMYDFLDKIRVCGSSAIWSKYYRGLPTEPQNNEESIPKWEEILNDIMTGIPYDKESELNELIDMLKDEEKEIKCIKCNGSGYVGIGKGIRGIKKCPVCSGSGLIKKEG